MDGTCSKLFHYRFKAVGSWLICLMSQLYTALQRYYEHVRYTLSQSTVKAPRLASLLQMELLPLAMPPVRPIMNGPVDGSYSVHTDSYKLHTIYHYTIEPLVTLMCRYSPSCLLLKSVELSLSSPLSLIRSITSTTNVLRPYSTVYECQLFN